MSKELIRRCNVLKHTVCELERRVEELKLELGLANKSNVECERRAELIHHEDIEIHDGKVAHVVYKTGNENEHKRQGD